MELEQTMTFEQFMYEFRQGTVIKCENVEQRRVVLQFLQDTGFKISSSSEHGLVPGDNNDRYLHPCMNGDEVTCRRSYSDRLYITFDMFTSFLNETDKELVQLSDSEFDDAFAEMMRQTAAG